MRSTRAILSLNRSVLFKNKMKDVRRNQTELHCNKISFLLSQHLPISLLTASPTFSQLLTLPHAHPLTLSLSQYIQLHQRVKAIPSCDSDAHPLAVTDHILLCQGIDGTRRRTAKHNQQNKTKKKTKIIIKNKN